MKPPRLGVESIRAPGGAGAREGRSGVDSTQVRTVRWGCELGPTEKGRNPALERNLAELGADENERGAQALLQACLTIRAVRATTTVSFSATAGTS